MISPDFFINSLSQRGIDFFAGVPDSLLKNICAYIADHKDGHHNIIAANEGAAVGLAAGHYLATATAPFSSPSSLHAPNKPANNMNKKVLIVFICFSLVFRFYFLQYGSPMPCV